VKKAMPTFYPPCFKPQRTKPKSYKPAGAAATALRDTIEKKAARQRRRAGRHAKQTRFARPQPSRTPTGGR